MDFIEKSTAKQNISETAEALILLEKYHPQSTEFKALLTFILIRVDDLLKLCNRHGRRIDFSDELMTAPESYAKVDPSLKTTARTSDDVTSLVKEFRDHHCHTHSPKKNIAGKKNIYLSSGAFQDKDGWGMCMGMQRLMFDQHLVRAFKETARVVREISQ